jgi:competence protein ComEC
LIRTILIKYESKYDINTKEISGKIIKYNVDGDKLSLVIKSKEKVQCTYYITSEKEKIYYQNKLKLGITIKLNGKLNKPINNTIPNTFNYKKYLYNHQIYYLMTVDKIVITNNKENIFYKIKNSLVKRMERNPNTTRYLKAFILGDISDMNSEVYKDFQTLGVSHLFAISGMNITLFAAIIIFLLKKLKIPEDTRYVMAILFLFFHLFLTAFSPSVLRATLFFVFLSINKMFYTNIKTINVYLFTLAILIFINPFILYDIGAEYSLITSLGLIIASEKLNNKNYFITLFNTSFIALLFSLGITGINFYEINFLSLINNLIFVPLVSFVIYPLALIVLILPFLNPLLALAIKILESLSTFFSNFSLNFLLPKTSIIFWLVYYIILIIFIKTNKKKYLVLAFLMLIINRFYPKLDSNNYAYFLDVGQGDSAVIITSHQKEVIMIDTGGKLEYEKEEWQKRDTSYHISDNTLIFLKSLGINKINLLIITHGDEDHAGEALNILNNFKVEKIILNQDDNEVEKQIRIKGNVIKNYNSSFLKILNYKDYNNENNNSLITYLNISNYKMLFMGDASKEQELDLLTKYNLQINLIKLGHHGSKTSSDYNFLKSIKVSKAIISG